MFSAQGKWLESVTTWQKATSAQIPEIGSFSLQIGLIAP